MEHESAGVGLATRETFSGTAAALRKAATSMVSCAIIAAIFLASWCRGLPGVVFMPYWYLNYSHGFVRRGLLGAITSPFLSGRSIGDAAYVIGILCMAVSVAVIICISLALGSTVWRYPMVGAAVVVFAASPALPRLATELGFPDIFLVGATVAVLACENSDRALWATVVCLIAPLIHEAFLFFCAPVLVALIFLRPGSMTMRRVAPMVAMLFSTAVVWFVASRHVVWASGIPIPQSDLNAFAAWELGQSAKLVGWPRPAPLSTVLCALSVMVSAVATGRVAGTRNAIANVAGALFTITIIAVAVDTDRFVAWAPVTSLLILIAALGSPSRSAGPVAPASNS